MSISSEIIGACFGHPEDVKTFSGVAMYLFREMSRRKRVISTVSTKDLRLLDLFGGAVDFSKIMKIGKPGMNALWCWKSGTLSKMSKRFNDRLVAIEGGNAVLQIGTHVRVERPGLKHYCFTDMTIAQACRSSYCKYFSIGVLKGKRLDEAIDVQKAIFENCQDIFVNSNWTRQSIIDDYGIHAGNVHVVGAGTSVNIDGKIDFDGKARDILFIGRNWELKNGPLLLDAFDIVRENIPDATLTIIGCNPKANMEGVNVLGVLDKNIREEKELFDRSVRRSSVLCVPSNIEAFGICFLESQLYGVVPVTFTGEGRADTMKNGKTGILIEERSAEALAETLIGLLSDPERTRNMGAAGHDYVKNKFTWKKVADKVLAVIDSQ